MDQNQTDMLQGDVSPPPAADLPPVDVPEVAGPALSTKQKKAAAEKAAAAAANLPAQVELEAPHGFIDDSGANRFWPAGAIVTVESEIKLLLARFAPLVGITYNKE